MSFKVFNIKSITPALSSFLGLPLLKQGNKVKNIDFKYSDLPRFQVDSLGGDTRYAVEGNTELNCLDSCRGYYNDKKLFIPTGKLTHERHYLLRGNFLLPNTFVSKEDLPLNKANNPELDIQDEDFYIKSLGLPSDEELRGEEIGFIKAAKIPFIENNTGKQSYVSLYEDNEGYMVRLETEDYFAEGILRDRIYNSPDYWELIRNKVA